MQDITHLLVENSCYSDLLVQTFHLSFIPLHPRQVMWQPNHPPSWIWPALPWGHVPGNVSLRTRVDFETKDSKWLAIICLRDKLWGVKGTRLWHWKDSTSLQVCSTWTGQVIASPRIHPLVWLKANWGGGWKDQNDCSSSQDLYFLLKTQPWEVYYSLRNRKHSLTYKN